jgi:hypothetical protein
MDAIMHERAEKLLERVEKDPLLLSKLNDICGIFLNEQGDWLGYKIKVDGILFVESNSFSKCYKEMLEL